MDPTAIAEEARQIAVGWSGPDAAASWWLTAALFDAIAGRDDLLEGLTALPPERLPALLASAAIAFVARRHPDEDLARYLPRPGHGQPIDDGGFVQAFAALCDRHLPEVVAVCADHRYQMSEVRRSAQIALGISAGGPTPGDEPVALVDIGAGAGFGLHLDRYGYAIGGSPVVGPTDALVLGCDVRGLRPPSIDLPRIAERIGIEVDPIDLADAASRDWLLACTPPERGAVERVSAAMAVARVYPAPVVAGDLCAELPAVLASLPANRPVVVVDSYVAVFLEPERRAELAAILADESTRRPVTWISLDPLAPLGPAGVDSVQGLTVPGAVLDHRADGVFAVLGAWSPGRGDGVVLARAHPSGSWVDWLIPEH